jgi:carbon monoxide dehydrogenase subunit G
MEFDNQLDLPLTVAEAWPLLLDIRRIAGCIPGAELAEVVDDRTYKGRVAVRLGPVALSLVGEAKLEEVDHERHEARVAARGADPKGRGSTDSAIRFRVEPVEGGSRVHIHSDVKLAGAIAQYGRGSGMIQGVAAQLIKDFGKALKAQIESGEAQAAAPISGLSVLGRAAWDSVRQKK